MNDFTVLGANAENYYYDDSGRRIWKCDGCGREDTWGVGWSWWGNYVRKGYWSWYDNGTMEWVACSPGCAEKLRPSGVTPPDIQV